jgi:ABC-type nitrate/sulfonate/bicarbonate transport system substrate-binding protein
MMLVPLAARAASAPYKVIYTFGGLNERSGILWVARDAGIFQKYGIDPTIVNVRNAQVGMSALAAGETQFHVGSATGTSIGAMAGGLDLAYIAGLINKLDGAFMVNPSIKTPADLKGKRVGVQSIGGGVWMFSMLAFEHWGLNPERDNIQFRIIGDQSVLAQAITQNIIDGGYLGYAYGAQLERQGYRMLGDLMKMGIPYQGLGMIARRSLIDRTPEIPERTGRGDHLRQQSWKQSGCGQNAYQRAAPVENRGRPNRLRDDAHALRQENLSERGGFAERGSLAWKNQRAHS